MQIFSVNVPLNFTNVSPELLYIGDNIDVIMASKQVVTQPFQAPKWLHNWADLPFRTLGKLGATVLAAILDVTQNRCS